MQPRSNAKYLFLIAVLTLVYIGAGRLCLKLAFLPSSASSIWLPTAIALTSLLIFGYRVWPAIAIGAFVINFTTVGSLIPSLGITLGNTLEGLLGAALVNKFARGRNALDTPEDVLKFVGLAGFLSTMVSATLGATSLALSGFAPWESYGPIWLTWWLGDVGGNLVAAPVFLLWSSKGHVHWDRSKIFQGAFYFAALIFLAWIVFGGWVLPRGDRLALEFLCIPPLICIAYLFSQREAALGTFILSGIAVWGTLHELGPFVRTPPNLSFLLLQAFLDVMSIMGLLLASLVSERRQVEDALRRTHDDLELRVQERTLSLARSVADLRHEMNHRRDLEERFGLLVEEVKDYAIVMLDPNGNITSWNNGAERIAGYQAGEIIGRHFSVFYTKEDVKSGKPARELKTAMMEGRVEDIGLRLRKDGQTFWADTIITALFDKRGQLRGYSKVTRDITERQQAEKKIQHYSDIVNNMQMGVVVFKLEDLQDEKSLRLISTNPGASQAAGLPRGSMVGKTLWEAFPDLYRTPLPRQLVRIVRTGRAVDFGEIRYGDAHVKEGVFYIRAFPLPDRCVGATFENVTERVNTKEALNQSEQRFQQLFNSNIIGFMMLDNQGRILEANDAQLKILGYSREDLAGQGIQEQSITPEQYRMIDQWMQERLYTTGMCPPIEKEFIRKDGCRVPVLIGKVQLEGKDRHQLCFVVDVTERRMAQDAMRKTYDELEVRVQQRTAELQQEVFRRQRAEEELRNQATRDTLTGLYNRRGFTMLIDPYMQLAQRQKKTLLLFMADMDNLKKINDQFGHAEGDTALRDAGDLLRKSFRQSDIIARIGGDEFAVAGVEETNQTEGDLINRLEQTIDDYNRQAGKPYRLRLSLGRARIEPGSSTKLEDLMKQADAVLYEQKKYKEDVLKAPPQ